MATRQTRLDKLRSTWESLRTAGVPLAAALALSILLLAASACSSGDAITDPIGPASETGTGTLSVSLTDAPDTLLASAVVHIGRVEAVPAGGEAVEGVDFTLVEVSSGG